MGQTCGSGLPIVAVLLLGTALVTTDCWAQAGQAERKHVELVLWYDGHQEKVDLKAAHDAVWMYQQYHPNVLIHITDKPTAEAYESILKWCGKEAKSAPDMVVMPDAWLPDFARYLLRLDRVVDAERLANIPRAVLTQLMVGGRLRAVPWRVDSRVLHIRRDLREANGLTQPENWQDVVELAQALHDPPGLYGIGLPGSMNGDGAAALLDVLWGLGAEVVDENGKLALEQEALAEALSSCLSITEATSQPQALTWSQAELEALFLDGRLGCVIADTEFSQSLTWTGSEMEWEVCPFAKNGEGSADITVQGLVAFRNSDVRSESEEFINLVCSEQCQQVLSGLGGVPAALSLIPKWRRTPDRAGLVANLERGVGVPPESWPMLRDVLGQALYLVLSGRQSPQEAASQAVAVVEAAGAVP